MCRGVLTEYAANGCENTNLGQNLGREAHGKERRKNTRADSEDSERIAHPGRGLRRETRDTADAQDGADHVPGLDETSCSGRCRSPIAASK